MIKTAHILLAALIILAGCGTYSAQNRAVRAGDFSAGGKLERDDFKKVTTYRGVLTYFEAPDQSVRFYWRAWRADAESAPHFSIVFESLSVRPYRFQELIQDSGAAFPLAAYATDSDEFSHGERAAFALTRAQVEEMSRTPARLRLYHDRGTITFTHDPRVVAGFLARSDRELKP